MLNNKNYIKTYEFDYENYAKKIFSILYEEIANMIIPIITIIISFFLDLYMSSNYNSAAYKILSAIEIVLIIILTISMLVLAFLPKKIVIYQNSISVKRNNISTCPIEWGISDNILYSSIVSCNYYKGPHFRGIGNPYYAILLFDWDSLVEIVCEKNKKYYIPVKDADDFIAEVNARVEKIKFFRALNIDNLLKDKNGKTISYYDLKVRWKSSDKIDSVYYIDDCGNNIDIIKYD